MTGSAQALIATAAEAVGAQAVVAWGRDAGRASACAAGAVCCITALVVCASDAREEKVDSAVTGSAVAYRDVTISTDKTTAAPGPSTAASIVEAVLGLLDEKRERCSRRYANRS